MDQDAELFATAEDFTEVLKGSAKKLLSISATGPVVPFLCGSRRHQRDACAYEIRKIHLH
jgi:hypothetical protein